MPIPAKMSDLNQIAASNSPAGTEVVMPNLDNYIRGISAILKSTNSVASVSIAAAPTIDVANADGESVNITGAATISSLGTGFAGCLRELRFPSAGSVLVHSSNLLLPGSANITVAANDRFTFRCTAAGVWTLVSKSRPSSSDVTSGLGYTPVNKAGDTMTGNLNISGASLVVTNGVGVNLGGPVILASGVNSIWAASAGTLFLRPNGVGSSVGQMTIDPAGNITFSQDLPVIHGGTGASTASGARTNLGITAAGTMALPVSIANGGTGSTTASGARTNLGAQATITGDGITKVTVSSAAPGALQAGELYLKY